MPKRIVIGLVAVVVIGVVVVMTATPNEESIQYHIEGFRAAERRTRGYESFGDRIRDLWGDIRGQPRFRSHDMDAMVEHEQALIRLGYLEERTFAVSNYSASNVWSAVSRAMLRKGTNREFLLVMGFGTNGIKVVTVKSNMPTDDEMIRELEFRPQKNH